MTSTKESAAESIDSVVIEGDLSSLSPEERVFYYKKVCESLGLNPLTRPFDYISKKEKGTLKEKVFLYARREATEQLRKIHGISLKILSREVIDGVYVVTAQATNSKGRTDESIGAVDLFRFDSNSKTKVEVESKANAMMASETKAKRRVTLSICGLGMLDESEISSVSGARPERIDFATGEILSAKKLASQDQIAKLKQLADLSPYPEEKILEEFAKSGASAYSQMTEEYVQKMINWLEPKSNHLEIQQGSKVA